MSNTNIRASASGLRIMAEEKKISPEAYAEAKRYLHITPDIDDWKSFWFKSLSFWGVLFIAAAIICFFAYNWGSMGYLLKFISIGTLIVALACLASLFPSKGVVFKLSLILLIISFAPLLAVFGQTYQTGAGAEDFIRAWFLFALVFALVARTSGTFILLWALGCAWFISIAITKDIEVIHNNYFIFAIVQFVIVIVWEVAGKYLKKYEFFSFLRSSIFPYTVLLLTMTVLFFTYIAFVFSDVLGFTELVIGFLDKMAWLYAAAIIASLYYYVFVRKSMFVISFVSAEVLGILFVYLGKLLFSDADYRDSFLQFVLFGLLIAAGYSVLGVILLKFSRSLNKNKAKSEENPPKPSLSSFSFIKTYADVFGNLIKKGLLSEDNQPDVQNGKLTWYVKTMLAFTSWIAAGFLVAGAVGALSSDQLSSFGEVEKYLVAGAIAYVVSIIIARKDTIWRSQFSLCLSFLGAVLICLGLYDIRLGAILTLSIGLVLLAISFFLVKNYTYRLIASVFFQALLPVLISICFVENFFGYEDSSELNKNIFLWVPNIISTLWYVVLTALMVLSAVYEERILVNKKRAQYIMPFLRSVYFSLWYVLAGAILSPLIGATIGVTAMAGMSSSVGFPAVAGFILLLYFELKKYNLSKKRIIIYSSISFIVILALTFYFPYAALFAFGLAYSRYIGSRLVLYFTALVFTSYIINYYYLEHITLLYKSGELALIGIVLAVIALVIYKFFINKSEKSSRLVSFNKVRSAILLCATAVVLFAFGMQAKSMENIKNNGEEIYIPLNKYDPRALFLGDYMELSYATDDLYTAYYNDEETDDREKNANEGGLAVMSIDEDKIASFVRIYKGGKLAYDERLVKFRVHSYSVHLGVPRFYLQEGTADMYKDARYGVFRLAKNGDLMLVDLK